MAAEEIQRLHACREDLWRKNLVLEATVESSQVGGSKLQQLRVPYPASGIDSMIETLKCLKGQGVDTRSIKSSFSEEELFAVLEIESTRKVHAYCICVLSVANYSKPYVGFSCASLNLRWDKTRTKISYLSVLINSVFVLLLKDCRCWGGKGYSENAGWSWVEASFPCRGRF